MASGGYWLTTGSGVQNNFTGNLPTVFSCLAELGTSGCGYEHQLQSIRGALRQPAGRTSRTGASCATTPTWAS